MFSYFKRRIHESVELQRADVEKCPAPIREKILQGEDVDSIGGGQGEFGSLTNPIPVNGALGEIKYNGIEVFVRHARDWLTRSKFRRPE